MDSNQDLILYQRLRETDQSALESLYDRYEKLVYSFAYRMTSNVTASEDIVQDVFSKLWYGKAEYNPDKGKFSSWLLTITRYTAIDHLRKMKKKKHLNWKIGILFKRMTNSLRKKYYGNRKKHSFTELLRRSVKSNSLLSNYFTLKGFHNNKYRNVVRFH